MSWLPWLVLSLVLVGLLLPGTTTASILVFQSSPSAPPEPGVTPTNTPVPSTDTPVPPTNTPVPPPTNTPEAPPPAEPTAEPPPPSEPTQEPPPAEPREESSPPTEPAEEQAPPPEEAASPTPVEAATPTVEGAVPPTEEGEAVPTEEASPTESVPEAQTPVVTETVETQAARDRSRSIINWTKFWDTLAVTAAYPWLCCGILLLLLVPVGLLYLEIKGRRRPESTPEGLPTRGTPLRKRPQRRDDQSAGE